MRVNCFICRIHYWLENVTICSASASWLLRAERTFLARAIQLIEWVSPWKSIVCLYCVLSKLLKRNSELWTSVANRICRYLEISNIFINEFPPENNTASSEHTKWKDKYEGWHSLAYQSTQSQTSICIHGDPKSSPQCGNIRIYRFSFLGRGWDDWKKKEFPPFEFELKIAFLFL